jgi:transposase-like protein
VIRLKVPKLRRQTFERAIMSATDGARARSRKPDRDVPAGISVRRGDDITEARWGTRVSPSTVSNLNPEPQLPEQMGERY